MATAQQVRNRAAYLLGLEEPGDTVSGSDDTYLQQVYSEVYNQLKTDGLNYWPSTGAVPDEFVPHVSALMAFYCTEDYSISDIRMQRIIAKARVADKEIRKLGQPQYESTDVPKDY